MKLIDRWSGRPATVQGSLHFDLGAQTRERGPDGQPVTIRRHVSNRALRFLPGGLAKLADTRGREGPPAEQVVPAGSSSDARIERYRLRQLLRPIQAKLQRACGHVPVGPVYVGAGWQRGTVTCKSAHACPACAGQLRLQRCAELGRIKTAWVEQGGVVGMLSLTVRHNARMTLERLRSVVCEAWRILWTGRDGRALRSQFAEYVRALDTTWGPNGWHPHIHALIFSDEEMRPEWLQGVRERWARVVADLLREAIPRTDEVGVQWSPKVSRAEYVTKLNLELSDITSKVAAPGHATPWQIARLAVREIEAGNPHGPMCALWREWTRGMKGARHLTWSRGLRAMFPAEREEQPEQDRETWAIVLQTRDWALARDAGLTAARLAKLTAEGLRAVLHAYRERGFWNRGPEDHLHAGVRLQVWRVWHPSISQQLGRLHGRRKTDP